VLCQLWHDGWYLPDGVEEIHGSMPRRASWRNGIV
jgi:hypothetical protein